MKRPVNMDRCRTTVGISPSVRNQSAKRVVLMGWIPYSRTCIGQIGRCRFGDLPTPLGFIVRRDLASAHF